MGAAFKSCRHWVGVIMIDIICFGLKSMLVYRMLVASSFLGSSSPICNCTGDIRGSHFMDVGGCRGYSRGIGESRVTHCHEPSGFGVFSGTELGSGLRQSLGRLACLTGVLRC